MSYLYGDIRPGYFATENPFFCFSLGHTIFARPDVKQMSGNCS
jgi:hypothetical protein